jgi:hypothetical protein
MLRVAARGLVDFSGIRWFDDTWYRRLTLMVRAVESEDLFRLREYTLQQCMRSLERGIEDPLRRKETVRLLNELVDKQFAYFRPWDYQEGDTEKRERDEATKLTSAWERRFGTMSDPATAARIQAVADAMLQMHAESVPQTSQDQGGIFNRDTAHLLTQKPRT